MSSPSDSSPLLVGQLLSSESSPGQPGAMSLTQPVDPTHSLSSRHLNIIPVHFEDENVFMSPLLKFKYGHEHLKPTSVKTSEVQCWQEVPRWNDLRESGCIEPGTWEARSPNTFYSGDSFGSPWGRKQMHPETPSFPVSARLAAANSPITDRVSPLWGDPKGPETSGQDGTVNSCFESHLHALNS